MSLYRNCDLGCFGEGTRDLSISSGFLCVYTCLEGFGRLEPPLFFFFASRLDEVVSLELEGWAVRES